MQSLLRLIFLSVLRSFRENSLNLLAIEKFPGIKIHTACAVQSTASRSWRGPVLIFGGAALVFAMGVGAAQVLPNDPSPRPAAVHAVNPVPSETELLALFRRTDWSAKELQGLEALAAGLGRSDELKRAFFKLLENPHVNGDLRSVILWQMDRFLLSSSEYKTYKKLTSNKYK